MLIYFAGSIRAGRNDALLYSKLVEILKKYGTVLTEHVGNPNLTTAGKSTKWFMALATLAAMKCDTLQYTHALLRFEVVWRGQPLIDVPNISAGCRIIGTSISGCGVNWSGHARGPRG